ncbi:MAG TPA: hypothetical protein PL196_06935 [Burkholderiaceae bacterium]|nr:hypothetical protein [Burkholderiaceae bacterium]
MSTDHAPVKTPLGHQELRQRTRRLSQRHRTVLLLVDGRRPLAEVLHMAHQAGAQVCHFEELVQLGMIDLPAPEPPPPPVAEADGSTDAVLAVEDTVPEVAAAALELDASEDSVDAAIEPPVPVITGVEPAAGGPLSVAAESAPAQALAATPPDVPPVPQAPAMPQAAPGPESSDKLDEARRLLTEILRRDTLLHRVFAPSRVRAARTQEELIGLVWEIERERAHARRKRGQLLALQRARELLGMGNTVVAEDSLPWTPSEP